jgi:hypothetical protein
MRIDHMYPVRDVAVDPTVRVSAMYWVPKPSEISEEGYGCYFRDVWPLVAVHTSDAAATIAWERRAADWVIRSAANETEYEALAIKVETYSPDDDEAEILPDELTEEWAGLGGLELGVAGLSYALSNAGFYPAASCRTHEGYSWADCPVVLFATGPARLAQLQPLVEQAGCGLHEELSRGAPLFGVHARSVVELMDLAQIVFAHRVSLRAIPKSERRRGRKPFTSRANTGEPHPRLF